jgi:hypothetical protein
MSLSIPSTVFSIFNEAVDNLWAKPILVVYPEIREECPNCHFNGHKSNGVYKSGGPYPFDNGSPCPYCNEDGYKMTESSEVITGRIYYNRKEWVDIGIPINIPNAMAQIVLKMTDLPKIQKCKYITPKYYTDIESYQSQSLILAGSYYPQGFTQNSIKYVTTFWIAKYD